MTIGGSRPLVPVRMFWQSSIFRGNVLDRTAHGFHPARYVYHNASPRTQPVHVSDHISLVVLIVLRYMMIKGFPCKVLSISVSKTGKHGHAKCNFVATDIFTGKKYEDMIPSTHGTTVPLVKKTEWELIDIDGDELTLMDEAGNQKTDLNMPTYPEGLADEIRAAWNGGENSVILSVQAAVGIEQVIGFKKDNASK
jgi:translation initiation factor 5A